MWHHRGGRGERGRVGNMYRGVGGVLVGGGKGGAHGAGKKGERGRAGHTWRGEEG